MKAPVTTKEFENPIDYIKQGLHIATIYSIVDLGTQTQEWKGETKQLRKVRIAFELPNIMRDFGKGSQPASIYRTQTLSMAEKSNLRPAVEEIIGKKMTNDEAGEFDINDLIGKNVQILVKHNGIYCNISEFLNYESEPVKQINETLIFSLDDFDENSWDRLGKKTQDKIKLSPEYKKISSKVEYAIDDTEIENLPF